MTLVVDASVAAKWVLQEDGSDRAAALRGSGDDLIAPSLIVAEIGNAVWKRAIWREVSARDAVRALQTAISLFTQLISPSDLAARSTEIASELRHPIYDCFYHFFFFFFFFFLISFSFTFFLSRRATLPALDQSSNCAIRSTTVFSGAGRARALPVDHGRSAAHCGGESDEGYRATPVVAYKPDLAPSLHVKPDYKYTGCAETVSHAFILKISKTTFRHVQQCLYSVSNKLDRI